MATKANVTKTNATEKPAVDGWLNVSLKVGDTAKRIGQSGIALFSKNPADAFLMERYQADPEGVLAKLNDNPYMYYTINISDDDDQSAMDKIAGSVDL